MSLRSFLIKAFIVSALLLAVIMAGTQRAHSRVLFIGNSYTYYNEGLGAALNELWPGSASETVTGPGYTLEAHWNEGKALAAIRGGGWKFVILQEQSQTPVTASFKFREYCEKFNGEIIKSGAQTILLMTWERPDSVQYGVTTGDLAAEFNAAGKKLGIKVAPAGLAFERSLREKPDVKLYSNDGHPTPFGTFLAACVIYGTITGSSPEGKPYSNKNIPADIRGHLETIAAKTLGYK